MNDDLEMVELTDELVDTVLLVGPLAEDRVELEHAPMPWNAEPNGATAPATDTFRLTVTAAADLCGEADAESGQLLGPLLLQGGRTIIVGDTGQGKTSLAFQMIKATLDQSPFLDWTGAGGDGRALIVDLEQGRRSVKRGLRDAGLDDRRDVDLILVPDGLSLDRAPEELAELDRVIAVGGYSIVDLDPYYKAHRADEPNAERPIVDLMRTLDQLRARHGFSLILPAHPRKDQVGAPTVRKLTIHDIAGSGAVTRGAEIVIAIERVAHGLARLRFLKDREGDLPIGEAWHLHYAKADGFTRDPKDHDAPRDYRAEILTEAINGEWRTVRNYMDALKAGDKSIRTVLQELVSEGSFEYAVGPEGRPKNAKCWRPTGAFATQMQLDPENLENAREDAAFTAPNADDDAMQHKPASAPPSTPNAADAAPQNPSEDLTAASGVFPVRGSTQDEAAGTSPPTLHSPPDADHWAEELAATVDLEQTAGTLDEPDA